VQERTKRGLTRAAGLIATTAMCCVLTAVAGAAAAAPPDRTRAQVEAPSAQRPNFVIILADDLGYADVGFNGRKEYRTPNLDRLAQEGTNFRRFYAGGVICGPSRASLLTGRYTIHHGVTGNGRTLSTSETTIAAALKPLGYYSALYGKWDSGETPLDHGFDEFAGYVNDLEAWEHFPKYMWFGREKRPVHGFSADLVGEFGSEFIKRRRNEPFFLELAFIEPHLKLEAPSADVAKLRGSIKEYDPNLPYNATYAAMIERLDSAVGRVLGTLRAAGLDKNTIVILTSDNGATYESGSLGAAADLDSNRPFRGGKRSVLEGGSRMPTAIRWPGHIPAGIISNDVLTQIDILPTFMAAAGAKPNPAWQVDGADELAVWQGKAKPLPRTIYWEYRKDGWYNMAAMSGDWKLVAENSAEFNALKSTPPISPEMVQKEEAALGEALLAGKSLDSLPPELARDAQAATGTMDAPKLFNIAIDPQERRNYYFARSEIALRLRQDLLGWLNTESAASKAPDKVKLPPPVEGGPD